MLANLSALELGRLRMSVGYGTHKKGRPLSPIEVGSLIRKARSEGTSLEECAKVLRLGRTSIRNFLNILDLPGEILHLIDWGSRKNFVSFSSAVELARLKHAEDQISVAKAALLHGLTSEEIRQVAQLRDRSGRSIEECLQEILQMRSTVEKRYVFIGSVASETADELHPLAQAVRDAILDSAIKEIGLKNSSGHLGSKFFTLVGNEGFDVSMRKIGKDNIERLIRSHISEAIKKGDLIK